MLLAYRLMRLIETHSDSLAAALIEKAKASDKIGDYVKKVPPDELKQRVLDVYQHLGQWLLGKSEADIAQRYTKIGALRKEQGVLLSQLIWAILLVKDNLLDFLSKQAVTGTPAEVCGELEIVQRLEQFFDHAIYYATVGYENSRIGQTSKTQANSDLL